MAILTNVTIYYPHLDPARPHKSEYTESNPTWEIQLRTTDPAEVTRWKEAGVIGRLIKYKDDHEDPNKAGEAILTEDGKKQWRANLRKRSLTSDMPPKQAKPVEVVDGNKQPLNPRIIGNGSIANVRIFLREYEVKGEKRTAPVLMGVQVTTLVKYEGSSFEQEEFDVAEMHIIENADNGDGEEKFTTSTTPMKTVSAVPATTEVF